MNARVGRQRLRDNLAVLSAHWVGSYNSGGRKRVDFVSVGCDSDGIGYEVTVPCSCYLDGRATRPPPVDVTWDAEEGFFTCAEDELDCTDDPELLERLRAFDDWCDDHCEHAYASLAADWLGNISMMGGLRQAVWDGGFVQLNRCLPQYNGGFVTPEDCALLIPELCALRDRVVAQTLLIVESTGEVLRSETAPGWVACGGAWWIALTNGWSSYTRIARHSRTGLSGVSCCLTEMGEGARSPTSRQRSPSTFRAACWAGREAWCFGRAPNMASPSGFK